MPTIDWNRKWNEPEHWPDDGDQWRGQADYCGQPYPEWKEALVKAFIEPFLEQGGAALEIAPGHGRWTPHLLDRAGEVHLVDMNPACLEHCRRRFAGRRGLHYHLNDGRSLSFLEEGSLDFIWSYDSFVHMEGETIGSYLVEFRRVLRPGGKAVIHHAGRRHLLLPLAFLAGWGRPGKWLFRLLSMKRDTAGGGDGDRGAVSRRLVRGLAARAGLEVVDQTDNWGERGEYDCQRFRDTLTILGRKG